MASSLITVAPTLPDFHFCHPFYNHERYRLGPVLMSDCLEAERQMLRGNDPVHYFHSSEYEGGEEGRRIEDEYHVRTCEISINAVDPAAVTHLGDRLVDYYIPPNKFREMAGWVIEQCIGGNPSMGGYVTRNISNAIDFLATTSIPPLSWNPFEPAQYRGNDDLLDRLVNVAESATFFTVTVGAYRDFIFQPGQEDPVTGGKIFTALHEKLLNMPFNHPSFRQLYIMAARIGRAWGNMVRKANGPYWWGKPSAQSSDIEGEAKDSTTYQCDDKLGNPKAADCALLQYSAFPAEEIGTLKVQPGEPTFLHSASCSIGISSLIQLTLTWDRIKAAVDEVIEVCVNAPSKVATGGRVYYGQQDPSDIGGEHELRKRNVTGLEALPPGANITLFQQIVPVPAGLSAEDEQAGCVWERALDHQDVRDCAHHLRPGG